MVHPGRATGSFPFTISATAFAAVPIARTKKRPELTSTLPTLPSIVPDLPDLFGLLYRDHLLIACCES